MEKLEIQWRPIEDEEVRLSPKEYKRKVKDPEYYRANRGRIKKKYDSNKKERRAAQKARDRANKEKKRAYYLRNKERIKERNNNYRLAHLEQYNGYARQRTIRKKMDKLIKKEMHGTKPKVMCIIGESGTGKTRASLFLQALFEDCNLIVSYTTRARREGETDGVEHWFVTPEQKPDKETMLAYTVFGDHEYWALKSDIHKDKISVYVIDEDGYRWFKEKYKDDYQLFAVRIVRDINKRVGVSTERLERDASRVPLKAKFFRTIDNNGDINELYNKIKQAYEDIRNK